MQVLQAVLAAGVWIVIYRWSPFTRIEKFLLLLSYFLFFEYFVMSRSYVLVALLGFAFVAVRQHQPQQIVLAWLLLGLLANIVMHATIWSMALAAFFAIEQRERGGAFYAGAALYLALLAFGIATMIPAADYGPWGEHVGFDPTRLAKTLVIPLGALVPVNPEWIGNRTRVFERLFCCPAAGFLESQPDPVRGRVCGPIRVKRYGFRWFLQRRSSCAG